MQVIYLLANVNNAILGQQKSRLNPPIPSNLEIALQPSDIARLGIKERRILPVVPMVSK